ncbi:MAG: hypothetical protein KY459_02580 [Acidobacteria bacterium]|nr:hypothetical protein [Acidobacteriota bacterium]
MKIRSSLLAALLIPSLIACGGGETTSEAPSSEPEPESASRELPSEEELATLIASSPEFGQYQFSNAAFTIPMKTEYLGDSVRAIAQDLARTGWIGFDSQGNVVITQRALRDGRFIVRPNDNLDIVPLARKQFGEVLAVGENASGDPTVDFSWRWIPNEIGAVFQSGPLYDRFNTTNYARATLLETSSGWEVLMFESIDPPAETGDPAE